MSRLFATTRRDVTGHLPPGQRLLVRAGYVCPAQGGALVELPAGVRLREIITRRVLRTLPEDAQMIGLPTEREGAERSTLPPALMHVIKQHVRTYRQLPQTLYRTFHLAAQQGNAQAGLLAPHTSFILEVYHLEAHDADAELRYQAQVEGFTKALTEMGIRAPLVIPDDGGVPEARRAHSVAVLLPTGPDTLARCPSCGQAFRPSLAPFRRPEPPQEHMQPLTKVETPGANTIRGLTAFLEIPASRTAKVVFYMARLLRNGAEEEALVVALVRGDMGVSEAKLRQAVHAWALRPAEAEEIRAVGAVPGFASPVGLPREGILVVVDELVARSPNLVAGANEPDTHYLNVNAGRDYTPDVVADIALAPSGAPCVTCGTPLERASAVLVGQFAGPAGREPGGPVATFAADDGSRRPVWLNFFRFDISRLMGLLAEAHHDEHGLCWPPGLAPYDVHLVRLGKEAEFVDLAERLYAALREAHLSVLYDDRDAGAGVKFTDADLVGAPLQVTVAPRALRQGGVEFKVRATGERRLIAPEDVVEAVRAHVA